MKAYSSILGTSPVRTIALLCAAALVAGAPWIASASGVVGTGTADSCTDAALDSALAGGGSVTFDCGPAPVTIDISKGTGTKTIVADTTIDGGGLVTISGGNRVAVFTVLDFVNSDAVDLTVENLTIANGHADGGGGIRNENGALTVANVTFTGNYARVGGAIFNQSGPLNVSNSNFEFNTASADGGGASGAAIFNVSGSIDISNSAFAGNNSRSRFSNPGGAISNGTGRATVTNSSFTNNFAAAGGGISNSAGTLTVTNSNFVGNDGGISSAGMLTVTNSTFTGNDRLLSFFGGGSGGGISNSGDAWVNNSAFSLNRATFGGGIGNTGTLSVANSTFTGNEASYSDYPSYGGGIANDGTLTVTNSTLTDNGAATGGSAISNGLFNAGGATTTLHDTIVANSLSGGNCFGTITDGGHNLDSGGNCGFSAANGSLSNTDPHLDPAGLRDNGGPTQTVALCTAVGVPAGCATASPAIDAGDDVVTEPPVALTTDQRGRARKSGLHVDMGAYEAGATITVNDTGDNTTAQDSKCTLREAIANVDAADDTTGGDCAAGTGNGDTIVFDLALPATITLTATAELAISRDVTISGPTTGALAVDGDHATRVFDIVAGTAAIANLTIQNGSARSGLYASGGGIAIASAATLALTNCRVSGNEATEDNGGFGGGIVNNGTARLTNCILSGNVAVGIANSGMATLTNCILSGNSGLRGALFNSGTVILTNSTLSDNFQGDAALYNTGVATLTDCTLSGNSGSKGGASGLYNSGMVTLKGCALRDNTASGVANNGTALLADCALSDNYGAGLSLGVGATATLNNCTLSGNSHSGVAIISGAAATLNNCTLSGNSAPTGPPFHLGGGGIYNRGTATLTNCTLSGNVGGGIFNFGGDGEGIATLTNTIVASSLDGGNCGGDVAIVDGGHNLSGDDTCVFGPSTDPRLAPLANYGGPTATLALCTAVGVPDASCTGPSPAIDAGDQAVCAMAPVNNLDQRGFMRPGSGHIACSIGAYEADAVAAGTCFGDCNGDCEVDIGELQIGLNMFFEQQPIAGCVAFDPLGAGGVDIGQLQTGLDNFFGGCPSSCVPE